MLLSLSGALHHRSKLINKLNHIPDLVRINIVVWLILCIFFGYQLTIGGEALELSWLFRVWQTYDP